MSPAPDVVQLKLSTTQGLSNPLSNEKLSSELVGTMEVVVKAPTSVWELDDWIAVYEDGQDQPLVLIPIRGRVLAAVQATPSSVVLPRVVGDAEVYSAECAISSTMGQMIRVRPIDLPAEISATPLTSDRDRADRVCYRLEWRTECRPLNGESRTVTVRFQVETDNGTEILGVSVRCRSLD